jgi:hypothetical protein
MVVIGLSVVAGQDIRTEPAHVRRLAGSCPKLLFASGSLTAAGNLLVTGDGDVQIDL